MLTQRLLNYLSTVKKVGVVGAGQMGTGIALVANRVAGLSVTLIDNETALKKSEDFIQKWVQKEREKKRLTEQEEQQMKQRFTYKKDIESLHDADFVVEAVVEDPAVKKSVFE